uniref:Predicted protein n=1 Tax=Hordeum vulgare subsp. vulgare TaxID=112509 RepID=F2D9T8_HORVV|nr:predicted protein [Hordeum vulgare subsp. vulgare]
MCHIQSSAPRHADDTTPPHAALRVCITGVPGRRCHHAGVESATGLKATKYLVWIFEPLVMDANVLALPSFLFIFSLLMSH